jgi:hypothetical protein
MYTVKPAYSRLSRLVGACLGALVGSVLRFSVALTYLYIATDWGFQRDGEILTEGYYLAAISAFIGVIIGGIAGFTCRPVMGAVIGAALSAGCCFGLIIAPASMGVAIIEGNTHSTLHAEKIELIVGWMSMTLAGALAGGIGAYAGVFCEKLGHRLDKAEPTPST